MKKKHFICTLIDMANIWRFWTTVCVQLRQRRGFRNFFHLQFFARMLMPRAWRGLFSNQISSSKSKSFLGVWLNALQILSYIIKIMPCAESDRSDCQPYASSVARSRRLRAVVVVEGWQSDLSPSTQGMIVFIAPEVNRSLTLFISVLQAHL